VPRPAEKTMTDRRPYLLHLPRGRRLSFDELLTPVRPVKRTDFHIRFVRFSVFTLTETVVNCQSSTCRDR